MLVILAVIFLVIGIVQAVVPQAFVVTSKEEVDLPKSAPDTAKLPTLQQSFMAAPPAPASKPVLQPAPASKPVPQPAPASKQVLQPALMPPAPAPQPPSPSADTSTADSEPDASGVVKSNKLPQKGNAVVILHAKWCGFCRQNYPEFEKAARKERSVQWVAIDIDGARNVADQLQCNAVPSVYLMRDGQVTKYNKKLKEADLLDNVREFFKSGSDTEYDTSKDGDW